MSMTDKTNTKTFINKNLISMLESIGLTANDSCVYLYLLESGLSITGSKIALVNKMHRQYVYNSLAKLESLRLVESVKDGKKLRWKALPPFQVKKLAEKKLIEAEEIEMELKKISTVGAEQDFEVYFGEKQARDFEQNFLDTLPLDSKQYIIGGSSDAFVKFFGSDYIEHATITKEKRFTTFYIGCKEELPLLKMRKEINPLFNYVILDEFPKTVLSTVIRFDAVTIHSVVDPPLIYVIKSKRVADDYKKFFDMLWNMAGGRKLSKL